MKVNITSDRYEMAKRAADFAAARIKAASGLKGSR